MTSGPASSAGPQPSWPPKLFGSLRLKLWIVVGCLAVLAAGVLTMPPAANVVAPSQERPTPLLGQEVQRREQFRVFSELQQLGQGLVRHSVTLPPPETPSVLPSDLSLPASGADPRGHGLIVSADGEVLTTAAALDGREVVALDLYGAPPVQARIVAFDPESDLVLLKADGIPPTIAAPWAMQPPPAGMLAIAAAHWRGQVTAAPVFVSDALSTDTRIRMTAANLFPGTPIFTVEGEVFAISVDGDASALLVAPAMERLRERVASGQARRGALGLTFQPVSGALAEAFPDEGALVASILRGGPAEAADVEPGDVLTAIGDTRVASVDEARAAIAALVPGSTVPVQIVRARKPLTIVMTASSALTLRVRGEPPASSPAAPQARRLFDAAALGASGMLPQSRILSINGRPVLSLDDARAQVRRARAPIVLYIEDERGHSFRLVERRP